MSNIKQTISIKGTCPQFNEEELKQRQQGFHNVYLNTDQCCTLVRGVIPFELLTNVINMASQGYTLTAKYPFSMDPLNYQCRMLKPAHMQEADLVALDEEIKQKYITEVEAKRAAFKELLKQQLLQKAESDEQKKANDKKAKLLADIEKQVEETFAPLVIPV
ncbi:hypothetical protein [Pseudomonas petrae]|uniref:hypothetical protein n=1 Tax=Pseudomonas petrae TaxID=2912190 RepID=UPI001F1BAA73|nr:hypothetical protein [Pseudomonas petrae]MCF7540224.1 hypothetical protein [Pseudomonas petrae]